MLTKCRYRPLAAFDTSDQRLASTCPDCMKPIPGHTQRRGDLRILPYRPKVGMEQTHVSETQLIRIKGNVDLTFDRFLS